jgi:hypothetical protein
MRGLVVAADPIKPVSAEAVASLAVSLWRVV